MPILQFTFAHQLNVSAQVGDTAYYVPTSTSAQFQVNSSDIVEIGNITYVSPDGLGFWCNTTLSPSSYPSSSDYIFFSKDKKGNYKESGSSAFRRSSRFVGEKSLDDYFVSKINEMRALPESAFAPAIKGLDKKFSPSYDTNIGKDDAVMQANMDNGQVEQFNNYWGTIHRVMWQNINKAIKAKNY